MRILIYLISSIALAAFILPVHAISADTHPYSVERAKALEEYQKRIAKNPRYTPAQRENLKKELFGKAEAEAKKKLREQARKPDPNLKKLLDEEKAAEPSQQKATAGKGAPTKQTASGSVGRPAAKEDSAATKPSTQQRVTHTGAEHVESGGAQAISFGGSAAPATAPATGGEGDVGAGGAKGIDFGGKK